MTITGERSIQGKILKNTGLVPYKYSKYIVVPIVLHVSKVCFACYAPELVKMYNSDISAVEINKWLIIGGCFRVYNYLPLHLPWPLKKSVSVSWKRQKFITCNITYLSVA